MVKESIAVEESLSKCLYKLVLYSVKVIPMVIAFIYLLNTVLSFLYIDLSLFSYTVQFLFICQMYLTSYAFKFCSWHRMFIHYILVVLIVNIIDYHYGVPISNRSLFLFYIILTTIFLFITLYLRLKVCKT